MKEIWRDVKGYEGLYQVSNLGEVRSLPRNGTINKIRIIKKFTDKYGYLYVSLNKCNQKKKKKLHRLIAEAFIPNPNNYPVVNHIDENKKNNNIDNLEWCSVKYNQNYSNYKTFKKVKCLNTGKMYDSIKKASEDNGLDSSGISKVCKGIRKSVGGLQFEYY